MRFGRPQMSCPILTFSICRFHRIYIFHGRLWVNLKTLLWEWFQARWGKSRRIRQLVTDLFGCKLPKKGYVYVGNCPRMWFHSTCFGFSSQSIIYNQRSTAKTQEKKTNFKKGGLGQGNPTLLWTKERYFSSLFIFVVSSSFPRPINCMFCCYGCRCCRSCFSFGCLWFVDDVAFNMWLLL